MSGHRYTKASRPFAVIVNYRKDFWKFFSIWKLCVRGGRFISTLREVSTVSVIVAGLDRKYGPLPRPAASGCGGGDVPLRSGLASWPGAVDLF